MPKFAANLTMMFTELPFLDRFAAAAAARFKAVEFLFPYDFAKDKIADRLAAHGLTLVLHNLPAGDWASGERGIGCLPGRIAEFRAGVGRAIDYATALDCPRSTASRASCPPASTRMPPRAARWSRTCATPQQNSKPPAAAQSASHAS